jgi:hypothetical protein
MVKNSIQIKARKEKAKKNTDIKRFYVLKDFTFIFRRKVPGWLKNSM